MLLQPRLVRWFLHYPTLFHLQVPNFSYNTVHNLLHLFSSCLKSAYPSPDNCITTVGSTLRTWFIRCCCAAQASSSGQMNPHVVGSPHVQISPASNTKQPSMTNLTIQRFLTLILFGHLMKHSSWGSWLLALDPNQRDQAIWAI